MKKIINMFRYTKQDEIISSIMNGFLLILFPRLLRCWVLR